ncbi:MAG TPA: thioredoxin family protein [Steroidobacteraceae bacterium]|nr:thioredoxin family protein [Steroidobacteraceae bacterium]
MADATFRSQSHPVVAHAEWLAARREFLRKEKEFTRRRDELSAARRALPWEEVTKPYVFDGASGRRTLAELFDGCSQLIVYHFMFAPDWEAGCKSCSFWADSFNGIPLHLRHRDVSLVAISRAPLAKLQAYAKRMGWSFPWYSSQGSTFNFDLNVSFTPEEQAAGEAFYNYEKRRIPTSDLVGISVFARDDAGKVFHTYSAYARGVDMMNGAYHYLDLTPKGRDEDTQPGNPQAWVRRHDEY